MENFVIAINETAMINCIYLKHFLFERYIVKNIHYTKNNEKYFVRIEPSQKLSNNTMKKKLYNWVPNGYNSVTVLFWGFFLLNDKIDQPLTS